jgi:putative thioredoxin
MSDSPHVFEVTQDTFAERVVEASRRVPVLVDFWAAWCAPCRMLVPILAKLAEAYQGKLLVAKVNTDVEQGLAMQYGVRSLPTVKLFQNGQVVDEFLGALPESAVREFVDQYVARESDSVREKALAAHRRGDSDKALALLREAATADPENLRVTLDRAWVLFDTGQYEEAEGVLRGLPANRQVDPEVTSLLTRIGFARVASQAPDRAGLERRVEAGGADLETRYQLACHRILGGDLEGALELLYGILREDRGYGDDAARRAMLAVFDLLGGKGPLVSRYRALMSSALY